MARWPQLSKAGSTNFGKPLIVLVNLNAGIYAPRPFIDFYYLRTSIALVSTNLLWGFLYHQQLNCENDWLDNRRNSANVLCASLRALFARSADRLACINASVS